MQKNISSSTINCPITHFKTVYPLVPVMLTDTVLKKFATFLLYLSYNNSLKSISKTIYV